MWHNSMQSLWMIAPILATRFGDPNECMQLITMTTTTTMIDITWPIAGTYGRCIHSHITGNHNELVKMFWCVLSLSPSTSSSPCVHTLRNHFTFSLFSLQLYFPEWRSVQGKAFTRPKTEQHSSWAQSVLDSCVLNTNFGVQALYHMGLTFSQV